MDKVTAGSSPGIIGVGYGLVGRGGALIFSTVSRGIKVEGARLREVGETLYRNSGAGAGGSGRVGAKANFLYQL